MRSGLQPKRSLEGVQRLIVVRHLGLQHAQVVPRRGRSRDRRRGPARRRSRPHPGGRTAADRPRAHSTAWASRAPRRAAPRTARAPRPDRDAADGPPPWPGAPVADLRWPRAPAVLPQRLDVVALLPEREAEIVVGETRALRDRGPRGRRTPTGESCEIAQALVAGQTEIALGPGEGGIELRSHGWSRPGPARAHPGRRRRRRAGSRRRHCRGCAGRRPPAPGAPARRGRGCRAPHRSRTG